MKKIVYFCDNCQKIIGTKTHLSITFADKWSGWVQRKSLSLNFWEHKSNCAGIKQFCNTDCLAEYFDNEKPLPNECDTKKDVKKAKKR